MLTEGLVTGSKTNFDLYLKEQLKDPAFSEQFEEAGEAWDIDLRVLKGREPSLDT